MDEATLLAEVELAERAKDFWRSDIGRYVLGRILEDIESATDDLVEVDPTDYKKVAHLQERVRGAKSLPLYLSDIIAQGSQAMQLVDEQGEP